MPIRSKDIGENSVCVASDRTERAVDNIDKIRNDFIFALVSVWEEGWVVLGVGVSQGLGCTACPFVNRLERCGKIKHWQEE